MRILFVSSSDMMAAGIAVVLKNEGNEVKLFIDNPDRKLDLENIVEKTDNWEKELEWVGEKGLIIFDDIGYGNVQEDLRKRGYSVFGGSKLGDKLETDREYAQKIFSEYGIKTVPTYNFDSISECIDFIRENKKAWVLKQNGSASKSVNHVSFFDDGSDVLDVLENMLLQEEKDSKKVTLQEKIIGLEVGVGRYFNGTDWVGPIEVNIEHKKLFPGDVGPMTSEMGTVIWYDDDESNRLFNETISKLKPYLQKIDFRGDFEVNCIVNELGAFPLEATPRFGSPAVYLQDEIQASPWGEYLKKIADGEQPEMSWRKGYGIVVLIAVPPFPYTKKMKGVSQKGIRVYFNNGVFDKEKEHIYFEGVAMDEKGYYISDDQGYVLYITGIGSTVDVAREKVYDIIKEINTPKMFYRNDIGISFNNEGKDLLREMGY